MNNIIESVRHGLIMAVAALILGALWAAYMATHHEQLHGDFEAQETQKQAQQIQRMSSEMDMADMQTEHQHQANSESAHPHDAKGPASHEHGQGTDPHAGGGQHSHSGSLAKDAMQRLLRGHIHFMGIGTLAAVLLLITAFTSLKSCWKKTLGWSFGLGALAYPPAWILMGLRTVELGPETAEASVMWLFGPAVGLLLASMGAVLVVLIIEMFHLHNRIPLLSCLFQQKET